MNTRFVVINFFTRNVMQVKTAFKKTFTEETRKSIQMLRKNNS